MPGGQGNGLRVLEIRLAAGGRANLFASEDCCVLVDDELLTQINCISSIVIATAVNFSFARAGQRIATVKSAPFAVAQSHLEAVINVLKERGPILQARPVRSPSIAVLYTDPVHGDRARQLFESIMRQRLEHLGAAPSFVLASVEEEAAVARSLQHLLRAKPTVILVASTTAPAPRATARRTHVSDGLADFHCDRIGLSGGRYPVDRNVRALQFSGN